MSYKLFDFLNDLNHEKKNILRDDWLAEKDYAPFLINLAMSLHPSSIMDANEMNQRHGISKQMHYDYYHNVLPKQKRYGRWPKKPKNELIDLIKDYYKVNTNRAIEYSQLLSDEDYTNIRKKLSTGGKF